MTTEKRFSKCKDMWKVFDWETSETLNFKEIINLLNELNEENIQLRKFIMDLQNMIQFDVDNEIKTYPKTLSEYLANALKVMFYD